MVPEGMVRDACSGRKRCANAGRTPIATRGGCDQFLIWAERGGAGRGAWEARQLSDPRVPPCEILRAAYYAKATGRVPMEPTESSR